jgi:PIN domain nuclease of toxin-antitoxin system
MGLARAWQVLLLDTNALVALLIYPDRFGKRTMRAIERADEVFCSSISLAELRIKSLKRKFDVEPVMAKLAMDSGVKILDFSEADAEQISNQTNLMKHDPFDRLILATASSNQARLITSDRVILALGMSWIVDSFE